MERRGLLLVVDTFICTEGSTHGANVLKMPRFKPSTVKGHYKMKDRHIPLYQREIQDLLYSSSGVTTSGNATPVRKYQTISLRPQSAKQLERKRQKVPYSATWFEQFAINGGKPRRRNQKRPHTAGASRRGNKKNGDGLRSLYKIPPPPYKSEYSERPLPFRPKMCGTKKKVNKDDPFYVARKVEEDKGKPKTNAVQHKVQHMDHKQNNRPVASRRNRPSSAGRARSYNNLNKYDQSSKKVVVPIGTKSQRTSSNPYHIRRRLQDTPNMSPKPRNEVPYKTAKEAVISEAGGTILNSVLSSASQPGGYDHQVFQTPGVFVEGTMLVPHENVGAVTMLAKRFCESMQTKDYDYGRSDQVNSGGVNVQLLVQSSQLHRLMSALQSLDSGVTMKLTMKTVPEQLPPHLIGDKIPSEPSLLLGSGGPVEMNGPAVLWESSTQAAGKQGAKDILKTLMGGKAKKADDGGYIPPTLVHMSPEKRAEKLELSKDLKKIAETLPAPCPVSLKEVEPDLQKAVLWPEKAAQKQFRERYPPKHIKEKLAKQKAIAAITSTAFARNLSRAARLGDRTSVNALLVQHKHNKGWVNSRCEDGTTALHHAADTGELEIVKDLLMQGANKKISAPTHGTPLDCAKKNLKRSISFHKTNIDRCRMITCLLKSTSVHAAAKEGDDVRLRYLYEHHGIDLQLTNKYGMTPLHLACVYGHVEAARYLHDMGGKESLAVKNNLGQTPLDIATPEVVEVLLEAEIIAKKEEAFLAKHRKIEEERQLDDERHDRMEWAKVRGTTAALPLAQRMKNRAVARENAMARDGPAHAPSPGFGTGAQAKGIYSAGVTSPSRFMRLGKEHTSANIAKRTRSQGMFSDRNYGKQHPARGTSKLRHVREFCRSDRAKDVLAAFHAYDRRVKPDREKGHPKIHDRNFDKWVSFHFGSVKA